MYRPDDADGNEYRIILRLMEDDDQIGLANMVAKIEKGGSATLIIPRGFLTLDRPRTFRLLSSINEEPEQEILSRKILQGSIF
jgi:hypothetical protein